MNPPEQPTGKRTPWVVLVVAVGCASCAPTRSLSLSPDEIDEIPLAQRREGLALTGFRPSDVLETFGGTLRPASGLRIAVGDRYVEIESISIESITLAIEGPLTAGLYDVALRTRGFVVTGRGLLTVTPAPVPDGGLDAGADSGPGTDADPSDGGELDADARLDTDVPVDADWPGDADSTLDAGSDADADGPPACLPVELLCDGLDDDCDGLTDEDPLPPACAEPDEGVCAGATSARLCQGAAGWTDCDYGPAYEPGVELSCDGLDNDCDGQTDDGPGLCPCEVYYYGAHSYLFCTSLVSWTGASAACAAQGYHLVTIDDAAENDWLRVSATAHGCPVDRWWIGYTDEAIEGTWVWEDGTAPAYENWSGAPYAEEQPAGGTEENCASFRPAEDGRWHDSRCDVLVFFCSFCEAGG